MGLTRDIENRLNMGHVSALRKGSPGLANVNRTCPDAVE
jgi:hypothetical protein